MSARRKRVISAEEIQFNHKPAKMLLTEKQKGVSQNGQIPSIIGICSYCVLDRPVFERCQTLLHPELTPWWSFLLADGAHHKKPHSPTHPPLTVSDLSLLNNEQVLRLIQYHMRSPVAIFAKHLRVFQLLWNLTGISAAFIDFLKKRYEHFDIQSYGFETLRYLSTWPFMRY